MEWKCIKEFFRGIYHIDRDSSHGILVQVISHRAGGRNLIRNSPKVDYHAD